MQTVIFCGGLGTRMREETEFRPKPMVPIGGRPILWHIMKLFAHYGHSEFVLPLGYKGEMIKDYFWHYQIFNADVTIKLGCRTSATFHNHCAESDWTVTLADTGLNSLKSHRLKIVEKYIAGDRFMCTYGDGVADVDLDALVDFHRSHGKMATITGVTRSSSFGKLRYEGDKVISFREKPTGFDQVLTSGGFFVFERKVFGMLSTGRDYDLEVGLFEDLARRGELMVYRHKGFWACMDTLRDMEYLNRLWEEESAPWKIW